MIDARGVCVNIGKSRVLENVSVSMKAGMLVAIVGANGAGKTTLLRTLSRLLPFAAGSVEFDGKSLSKSSARDVARAGLAHVPQGRQIIPGLSVEDNLLLGAKHIPGLASADLKEMLDREYRRFPVLRERKMVDGSMLSGGEQQMLAISRSLMMRPKLLMLDEPSLGLAPLIVKQIAGAMLELRKSGMSILLVEQAAKMALKIADYGYVMRNGRIVMEAPADELLHDQSLILNYLN